MNKCEAIDQTHGPPKRVYMHSYDRALRSAALCPLCWGTQRSLSLPYRAGTTKIDRISWTHKVICMGISFNLTSLIIITIMEFLTHTHTHTHAHAHTPIHTYREGQVGFEHNNNINLTINLCIEFSV